jgi:hypothetical protein
MLIKEDKLYKPIQTSSEVKELDFYSFGLDKISNMKPFLPKFYGSVYIKYQQDEKSLQHIVLEDLTQGFKHPCLVDLKIGKRTYDENATQKKIEKEINKYPPQEKLGFRFTGIKVWQPKENNYKFYDRFFGQGLKEENINEGFKAFLYNGEVLRDEVIGGITTELEKMYQEFKKQNKFRFYTSSILIIYDGDFQNNKVVVKFIDPARCFKISDGGVDESVIYGIRNLIDYFKKFEEQSFEILKKRVDKLTENIDDDNSDDEIENMTNRINKLNEKNSKE